VVEAGIAPPAVGVEDPEHGLAARRPEPAAADHRLGPLTDDVATEADPRPSGQLEAERGGLGHGAAEGRRQRGRLHDEQQRVRPSGDRRESPEALDDGGRYAPAAG
jgi:hypothetical protein